jgi:hypothetical protein
LIRNDYSMIHPLPFYNIMKLNHFQKKSMLLGLLAAVAFQIGAHNGVSVRAKLFLSGSLETNGLMRDDIRTKGLLPSTEPYSDLDNFKHHGDGGGEVVASPAIFQVTGNDAIVDWVVVELRSANNLAVPVSSHAALLQRDGDVVGTDGVSPVHFVSVAPGLYHVSVKHRNHLGVMTAKALLLSDTPLLVDFADTSLPLYGTNACKTSGDKRSLWLGDCNRDKRTIHQGPGNDIFKLFSTVMSAPNNTQSNGNYMLKAYSLADFNMDGYAILYGPNNDRAYTFQQAAVYSGMLNYILTEQIPD